MPKFRGSIIDKYRLVRNANTLFLALPQKIDARQRPDDVFYDVKSYDTLTSIAATFLEDSRRWWIIMEYNNISDPFVDLSGRVLRLPSIATLYLYLI